MNRSPAASTATPVGRLRGELVAAFAPDPPGNTAPVGPQVPVPATVEIWLTDGTIFRTTQLPVSTAYSSPRPPMDMPLGQTSCAPVGGPGSPVLPHRRSLATVALPPSE